MRANPIFTRPARLAAIAPYLWMLLFFLVPFGFVLKISLSQTAIAQPPYLPLFDMTQGLSAIKAAFAIWARLSMYCRQSRNARPSHGLCSIS